LCASGCPVVHCASDTRFSERMRREITEANLGGLEGILALARDSRAAGFHYISTAYAAGKQSGVCAEELAGNGGFTNVYEETKALAERRVAEFCAKEKVPYTVIRPSIVYGDSRTGRSTRFNALYHPVKSLSALRGMYEADIRLNGGKRARAYGIGFSTTGAFMLPLRFFLPRRGTINLIPVEYFTAAVLSVMERGEPGGVFHLTSDSPKPFDDLTEYCMRYLGIEGMEIVDGPQSGPSLSPPEALLQRYLEPYIPYFSDNRSFSRERAARATGRLAVPELTYDVFKRCMDYAVGVDWQEGPSARRCAVSPENRREG
jgi:nucleoside-diphosphate-sugar epimerase